MIFYLHGDLLSVVFLVWWGPLGGGLRGEIGPCRPFSDFCTLSAEHLEIQKPQEKGPLFSSDTHPKDPPVLKVYGEEIRYGQ